jgi:transcriptional repressor NrdR
MKSCEKRPIDRGKMEEIADNIERKLSVSGKKEVSSRKIGNIVINELFKIDPVAYIRFASVYNNFDSPEEFRNIAVLMKKGNSKKGK